MKPVMVLLVSFGIAIVAIKLTKNDYDYALAARIAMSVMLCFTAMGHFLFTDGMAMMIPDFITCKK